MQRCLALAVAFLFLICATVRAESQVKPARRDSTRTPASKTPTHVEIKDAFVLATPFERWALDDPLPSSTVTFDGKNVTVDDRHINKSIANDGDDQWLYPVGWYEPYAAQPASLKYVVVKYKNGRACQVMAEYQPQTYALPKANFEAHPDGKSFYCDLTTVRQDGLLYVKQAISQGREDGHDGLWVDILIMYCVPDATTSSAKKP